MKSPVVKRSIVIAGHKTSVSLEDAFWTGLKEIAERARHDPVGPGRRDRYRAPARQSLVGHSAVRARPLSQSVHRQEGTRRHPRHRNCSRCLDCLASRAVRRPTESDHPPAPPGALITEQYLQRTRARRRGRGRGCRLLRRRVRRSAVRARRASPAPPAARAPDGCRSPAATAAPVRPMAPPAGFCTAGAVGCVRTVGRGPDASGSVFPAFGATLRPARSAPGKTGD